MSIWIVLVIGLVVGALLRDVLLPLLLVLLVVATTPLWGPVLLLLSAQDSWRRARRERDYRRAHDSGPRELIDVDMPASTAWTSR